MAKAAVCCRTLVKFGGQVNTANQFQIPSVLLLTTVMIAMMAGASISLMGQNYLLGYFLRRGAASLESLFLNLIWQE